MYSIAGVDEAGRGSLAGPVVAAAVILNDLKPIIGLNDSKLLKPATRIKLYHEIKQQAIAIGIGISEVEIIEKFNILQATLTAMHNAVLDLKMTPNLVLVDGNCLPKWPFASKAIVGGDRIEPAISAASIIAKVTRDHLMLELDQQDPEYGFAKHKGYGTKEHINALKKYGQSKIHRSSFLKKILPLNIIKKM